MCSIDKQVAEDMKAIAEKRRLQESMMADEGSWRNILVIL